LTKPKFDFGDFNHFWEKFTTITFSNSQDPDQRAPTGALLSGSELFEKNDMDSLQGATGLNGLTIWPVYTKL